MSEDKDGADIEDVLSSIRRLVAKTAPAQTVSSAERRGALRAEPRLRPTRPVGDAVEQKLVLSPSQRVSEPENPWAVIPLDPADHASGDERAWAREDRLADYADGGASPSAAPQDALGAALTAAADPLPDQADAAQQDAPERHHNFISTEIADEDGYDEEVETLTLFAAPPPPLRAKPKAEPPLSTRLSPSQRGKKMILQRRILLMTCAMPRICGSLQKRPISSWPSKTKLRYAPLLRVLSARNCRVIWGNGLPAICANWCAAKFV